MDKQVCPRCGSAEIGLDTSNFKSIGYGGATFYKCKSCGFLSNLFPVMKEEYITDFAKNIEELAEEAETLEREMLGNKEEKKPPYKKYVFAVILVYFASPIFAAILAIIIIIYELLWYNPEEIEVRGKKSTINLGEQFKKLQSMEGPECFGDFNEDDPGCADCSFLDECKTET